MQNHKQHEGKNTRCAGEKHTDLSQWGQEFAPARQHT